MIEEARKQAAEILADGHRQFAELNARYKAEYEKLEQLNIALQLREAENAAVSMRG